MEKTKNDFTQGKMWRVIMRMAIPMMLAQLVNVLYNVVDRMYIGHIPGVGALALTGIGLAMPIISVVIAFTNLFSNGGGPLCSIARGEGDKERAELVMGNTLTLLLGTGIALTVLLSIFMEPILYRFGASTETFPYAGTYTRIYLFGTVFTMISGGMNAFINAQGFGKMGMLTVMVGAVVNIILDPIFIFVFHLGVAGAAWATVIAQFCSAIWVMRFLLGPRAILDLRLTCMKLHPEIVGKVLALGVTGFVMGITTGLVQMASNVQLQRYGGDVYVGVMTVINSVKEIMFLAMHGFGAGAQPVLGYNYGAKAYDRVRSGIRFFCVCAILYAGFVWILSLTIPSWLIRIFNQDAELVRVGVPAMRIYFCGFIFMSMQSAGQNVFVSLGKAKYAVCFSILRKVVIVLPLVYLLPLIPALGVHGVFWAEPVSDLLGGGACFITMYFTVYRAISREQIHSELEG